MLSLRRFFAIPALLAALSVASAESDAEARKQARAEFLKAHAEKQATAKTAKKPAAAEAPAKPLPVAEKAGKKEKEKKKDEPREKEAERAADGPAGEEKPKQPKLSLPLPKGQDSKGVVIPYADATGKKSMVFNIGVGNRLDDDRVNMIDLLIEMFDEAGQKEMTIELPASQMNLSSRIIQGDQGVTIKRADFQLTGQTMEFNTESKQGWLKGKVKMIIFDLSEKTGEAAQKKEGQGS